VQVGFIKAGEYPTVPDTVLIVLTEGSAANVFAKQSQAVAMAYGTNLLRDARAYFGVGQCEAGVAYTFHTYEWLDAYDDDEWYASSVFGNSPIRDIRDSNPIFVSFTHSRYS
jgi:hypothetical protein